MKKINICLFILIAGFFISCRQPLPYRTNDGFIQGSTYHIIYQPLDEVDLQKDIESELLKFDNSLSTYNPNSIISRVNQNDSDVVLDDLFIKCFTKAQQVSEISEGAFDLTVAPLVNAWGFGFKNKIDVNAKVIDSIMQFTGYQKVKLINNKIIKSHPSIQLDASAIAQGFSVDIISEFLESKGIVNYMVEIGGEVRAKGINSKGQLWRIGIDKPIDGSEPENRELQNIVNLKDKSISTSGNYRKFYIKDGIKYSHTINPKTGYPAQSNLLSASVLADDCMTADAFATVCMVIGVEKAIELDKRLPEIEIYLIFADSTNQFRTYASPSFEQIIEK
jgi:FAD:protein FMN transferase